MSIKKRLVKNETDGNTGGKIRPRRRSQKHFTYHNKELKIDFVLAAKHIPEDEMSDKDKENLAMRKQYFRNLKKKHLKISRYYESHDEKTLFWCVHAPYSVLADSAEDLHLQLPTVQSDLEVHRWYEKFLNRIKGCWSKINPCLIKDTHFPPRPSYFSDTFDKNRLEEFYPIYEGGDKDDLFPQTERSRLVSYILESTCFGDDGHKIGKACLLSMGVFTAAYPCHDGPLSENDKKTPVNNRQKLQKEWASFRKIFKYQPLQGICDYFGVKIAFYYAWIGFYTMWLVPASLVGILCFFFGCLGGLWFQPINDMCNKNKPFYMCPLCDKYCTYYLLHETSCIYSKISHCFDNDGTPVFAVFMSMWSVFYLEYWKRKQWCLSYEWHTIEFHEEEIVRPQYAASAKKFKKNPVTEKMEPIISKKDQWLKIAGESSVVFFFISLVIGSLVSVIVYRAVIFGVLSASGSTFRRNSKLFVTGTAATINLIVINILKLLYEKLALIMTDWENPRTRTLYEKSFTVKMFWFQFVNTFSSIFYVAFFKNEIFVGWPGRYRRFGDKKYRFEGCSEQGCFLELCLQVLILMGGQQLFGNIVEIVWPWMRKKYNTWKNDVADVDVTVWEKDYQLADQEENFLFWEYQEVVLQYGFVTMFVAAFPLAPLIALLTNLVEIRIDAINMVTTFRRPIAYKTEGIGVWYDILVTLTALAVLINGFVIALTSDFIPRLVYKSSYSVDGSLTGYLNWSLSYFNVSHFTAEERPDTFLIVTEQTNVTFCRYSGYHQTEAPYSFDEVHWYIMTVRLVFAFLFQWTVSATGRFLAWLIPDKPTSLQLKMKRKEHLAKVALRNYKLRTGKRLAEKENCSSEEEESENGKHDHTKNTSQNQTDDVQIYISPGRAGSSNTLQDNERGKQNYIEMKVL